MEKTNTQISQIKLGAVLGYVNYAVRMIIQLLYVPIMLRLLGQSEYGVYQLVASIISYLSLLNFGFGGAYLRFYSQCGGSKEKEAELNGTFLSVFLFFSLLALIVGAGLTVNSSLLLGNKLTKDELSLSKVLLAIMSLNMALTFPISVFSSIISSRECFVFQRLVELLKTIANPFLVIALLLLGYGSVGMVLITTGLNILGGAVNIWYVKRKIRAPFSFKSINFNLIRSVSVFSFFLFLNSIIDQVNWNVDKYILARFVGSVSIAIYSVGAHINEIFIQIADMLATVLAPRVNMIAANAEDPLPELNVLFRRVGRLQSMIVLAVIAGFSIFGREFIFYWAGEGYEESYIVTLLLIVPVGIPLCQTLGVDIQRALNKHQYRSVVYAGIAIANVIISIPLTKAFGAIGAAMGTTISLLLGNGIVMNIMYQKLIGLKIKEFWIQIIRVVPAVVPPVILSVILKNVWGVMNLGSLLAQMFVFTLAYGLCLWLYGFNRDEKDMVTAIIKRSH